MKTTLSALLVLCIFMLYIITDTQAKKKQTKFDKFQKKRKDECTLGPCAHLPKEVNDNCVNQCFSLLCFNKIYAENPLEEGEYDVKRWKIIYKWGFNKFYRQRTFTDCTREEFTNCTKNADSCPPYMLSYI